MRRILRRILPLGLALVAFTLLLALNDNDLAGAAAQRASTPDTGHDWLQFGFDASHSSASPAPTGITAANIGTLVRHQVTLPGVVDASPIYLHGVTINGAASDSAHDVFFLTTTYGKTVAVDARDGSLLWTYTPEGYDSWANSRQITTATPLADANRQFIYATSPDGYVQKLAVADGRMLWRTSLTLLPAREKLPSPITEFNGHLIVTTGGYIGDRPPYQGHVAVLDTASGKLEQVWNSLCSDRTGLIQPSSCPDSDAAIWGRAGAVLDPANGDIFVTTGNAPWDGKNNWGDAVIELDPAANHIIGNYTPTNTDELNDTDKDLGSTSPALFGGDLIAQGGKDGHIRLLSRKAITGAAPHKGEELQIVSTPSGTDLFTALAVWHQGGDTWVFAADNGGTEGWKLAGGQLASQWKNSNGGTSPVVAGGLLYIYAPRGGLHVYDPTTGKEAANLPCGAGHWNSPIVIDGHIALPEGNANRATPTGVFDIWSLP